MKLEDCWWLDYENCLKDLRDLKRLTKAEHLVADAIFAAYFSAFGPRYDVKIYPAFFISTSKQKTFGQYKLRKNHFSFFEILDIPARNRATFHCDIILAKEDQVRIGTGNLAYFLPYRLSYSCNLKNINPKTKSQCISPDYSSAFLIESATKQQYENKHGPITCPGVKK